jgi:hypothetical protein
MFGHIFYLKLVDFLKKLLYRSETEFKNWAGNKHVDLHSGT